MSDNNLDYTKKTTIYFDEKKIITIISYFLNNTDIRIKIEILINSINNPIILICNEPTKNINKLIKQYIIMSLSETNILKLAINLGKKNNCNIILMNLSTDDNITMDLYNNLIDNNSKILIASGDNSRKYLNMYIKLNKIFNEKLLYQNNLVKCFDITKKNFPFNIIQRNNIYQKKIQNIISNELFINYL